MDQCALSINTVLDPTGVPVTGQAESIFDI